MRQTFLPFARPLIGEEEIAEVVDTLRSGWITTGPKTARFEAALAAYLGARGALGLSSCTAGLHTALVCLGIGPGDEVITTTLTFCSTVNVVEHVGARPVLVDVEPDTLNIDPAKIEAAITPRTKAIIPVHYAGHPVDLDPIVALATATGLAVLEDAAHALPASYKGRMIGSGDNPVSFSFYATKNLTTGEGGMLTGSPEFLERARVISLHGLSLDAWKRYGPDGSWSYDLTFPGFKYNMTDLQASLGLHQLARLRQMQRRRLAIVNAYQNAFAELDALECPTERPEVQHAWHLYVLRLRRGAVRMDRNRFIEELKERNIGTSVHYRPIHMLTYYRNRYGFTPEAFPISLDAYERMVSLPLSPKMTDQDVQDVIEAVSELVVRHRA
jgi:dTDP-4-amino-4,6-dideoxygalactose transaminase